MAAGEQYRELGEAAWAWVLGQVRGEDGPWLPDVVSGDEQPARPAADRDSVYAGIGGLAPLLAEIGQYRALTGAEQALGAAIAARLRAKLPARSEGSLYDGLGGDVLALRLLAPGSEQAALGRLAELMTPLGWNTTTEIVRGIAVPITDLILGSAGVVLAAVWARAASPSPAPRRCCTRRTGPRAASTGPWCPDGRHGCRTGRRSCSPRLPWPG